MNHPDASHHLREVDDTPGVRSVAHRDLHHAGAQALQRLGDIRLAASRQSSGPCGRGCGRLRGRLANLPRAADPPDRASHPVQALCRQIRLHSVDWTLETCSFDLKLEASGRRLTGRLRSRRASIVTVSSRATTCITTVTLPTAGDVCAKPGISRMRMRWKSSHRDSGEPLPSIRRCCSSTARVMDAVLGRCTFSTSSPAAASIRTL